MKFDTRIPAENFGLDHIAPDAFAERIGHITAIMLANNSRIEATLVGAQVVDGGAAVVLSLALPAYDVEVFAS